MVRLRPVLCAVAAALAVVALSLRAFGAALDWPLADADAWANVAWAGRPLREQLLVPLTGGVAGDDAHFWRPAAMLMFWVQRRLFGWAPAGWAAWNIGLHSLSALLAGSFVVRCSGGTARGAVLAALVTLAFAAHPLAEDVVPAAARSIDLLLAVSTFGALLALSYLHVGGWRAWVAFLGAVAVALGTKETAVLLLPLSALWVGLFRGDLRPRARARAALRVAMPVAVLVGAWLGLRASVLGGLGGYYEAVRPEWVWSALERGFIEPFVPSLSAWVPRGWATLLPAFATWIVLLRWGWSSPDRALVIFAASWFVAVTALHAATGTLSRRVYYVPTLPALLLVLPALLHGIRQRRGGLVAGILGAAWALAFLHGSPVVFRYRQWSEVSRASEVYRDEAFWSSVPVGTRVWLLDRPFRADIDPRTFRFWGGRGRSLHHGAPAYAVEAWLGEVLPGRGIEVETLTGTALTAPLAAQRVDVLAGSERVVVHRVGADRQRWPVRGPFAAESDGDTLTVYARRPTTDRVVVWTPGGLVLWP